MMRLLQFLFLGHFHKWKTLSVHNLVNIKGQAIGGVYIQQCEHCGVVKRRTLD